VGGIRVPVGPTPTQNPVVQQRAVTGTNVAQAGQHSSGFSANGTVYIPGLIPTRLPAAPSTPAGWKIPKKIPVVVPAYAAPVAVAVAAVPSADVVAERSNLCKKRSTGTVFNNVHVKQLKKILLVS